MLATNTDPDSDPAEEKLRWAFKVYDKDSSGELGTWKLETGKQLTTNVQIAGTIDCKELKEIVGNLYESEGYSQVVLSVALSRLITVIILLYDIHQPLLIWPSDVYLGINCMWLDICIVSL